MLFCSAFLFYHSPPRLQRDAPVLLLYAGACPSNQSRKVRRNAPRSYCYDTVCLPAMQPIRVAMRTRRTTSIRWSCGPHTSERTRAGSGSTTRLKHSVMTAALPMEAGTFPLSGRWRKMTVGRGALFRSGNTLDFQTFLSVLILSDSPSTKENKHIRRNDPGNDRGDPDLSRDLERQA